MAKRVSIRRVRNGIYRKQWPQKPRKRWVGTSAAAVGYSPTRRVHVQVV